MVNKAQIKTPVIIQDLVVYSPKPKPKKPFFVPLGEFDSQTAAQETQKVRLYETIRKLTMLAAIEHKKTNYNSTRDQIRNDRKNHITRVVTNEFLFYTRKPLTLKDFEQLQNSIYMFVKNQPKNLHLVLSSFAVVTPDHKIMNVVAHIQCGETPKMHFVVKNHPSNIDPVYKEKTVNGKEKILPNISIYNSDTLNHCHIRVAGKVHSFLFNNVIECKTLGEIKFNTCIDICLDHKKRVARDNMKRKLQSAHAHFSRHRSRELFALQCSHIVTSNKIGIYRHKALGTVTHADPKHSKRDCKSNVRVQAKYKNRSPDFGTKLFMKVTAPTACSKLPHPEKRLAKTYNKKVLNNIAEQQRRAIEPLTKMFTPNYERYKTTIQPKHNGKRPSCFKKQRFR